MLFSNQGLLKVANCILLIIILSCKKSPSPGPVPPTPPPVIGDTIIKPGVDPSTANTIGFFLDDWLARTFTVPSYTDAAIPASTTNTVTVDATSIITKIPLSEFGHNAVWWMVLVAV